MNNYYLWNWEKITHNSSSESSVAAQKNACSITGGKSRIKIAHTLWLQICKNCGLRRGRKAYWKIKTVICQDGEIMGDFPSFWLLLCLCHFYFLKWKKETLWDFSSPLLGMAVFTEHRLLTKKDASQRAQLLTASFCFSWLRSVAVALSPWRSHTFLPCLSRPDPWPVTPSTPTLVGRPALLATLNPMDQTCQPWSFMSQGLTRAARQAIMIRW